MPATGSTQRRRDREILGLALPTLATLVSEPLLLLAAVRRIVSGQPGESGQRVEVAQVVGVAVVLLGQTR